LIPKRESKLFVGFVGFCKPLCLGSKARETDSQKETKETKGATDLNPRPGDKLTTDRTDATDGLCFDFKSWRAESGTNVALGGCC